MRAERKRGLVQAPSVFAVLVLWLVPAQVLGSSVLRYLFAPR